MLVAVRAAAVAVWPCQMEPFGEEACFVVERGGFEDGFVFGGDEERDEIRLVFKKPLWLLEHSLQQRDGIAAGADRAIEADADRASTHSFQNFFQMGCG